MEKKITKAMGFTALADYLRQGVLNGEDVLAFVDVKGESVEFTYEDAATLCDKAAQEATKRTTTATKAKSEKTQEENKALADAIFYHMNAQPERHFKLSEMVNEFPELSGMTDAKARSAVHILIEEEKVASAKVKGRMEYYVM